MLLGVYKGNGSDGRKALPAFEAFIGRRVDLALDFLAFESRQSCDTDACWTAGSWGGCGRPLVLAVPLACRDETLAEVAAGKHDASYTAMAQAFIAEKVSLYAIRLGWEDNCQTTPGYALQDKPAGFANYKAARRRIYALLKALLPTTLILQDVQVGWQQVELTEIYDPASCDAIGLTVYPQTWSADTAEPAFTPHMLTESWGLNGFGAWPPLPILITEYGAAGTRSDGHGAPNGGDDPTWTKATLDTFRSWGAHCLGVCVWDFHASDFNGLLSDGDFPQAGAVLKAAFAPPPVTASAQATDPPLGRTGTYLDASPFDGEIVAFGSIAAGGIVGWRGGKPRPWRLNLGLPTPRLISGYDPSIGAKKPWGADTGIGMANYTPPIDFEWAFIPPA